MSGKDNIFLDTNAIISILSGEINANLSKANAVFVSVISQIEFLSFEKLGASELNAFNKLIDRVKVIYLDENEDVLNKTIEIRQKYKLKLPDAIIAAKAIVNDATLITHDKGFKKIQELKVRTL